MADTQTTSRPAKPASRTFPDSSITLVEFSGEGLGILLAQKTERDPARRRLVLKKAAYVRLERKDWGAMAFPEVWIEQDHEGLFIAVEAQTGKIFRHPSLRRYEVAFLAPDVFECSIQCLKEKRPEPLYELIAVTFASRPDFSVEAGFLVAPDDYAAEQSQEPPSGWIPLPPRVEMKPLGA